MNNIKDIERAVIAGILDGAMDGKASLCLRDIVPEYFEDNSLRAILEAAQKLENEGTPPTIQNLCASRLLRGIVTESELTGLAIYHSGFDGHGILTRQLVECYGFRELRNLAKRLLREDVDFFEIQRDVDAVSARIGRAVVGVGRPSKEDQVDSVHRYFEDVKSGNIRQIPTPWRNLNRALRGGLSESGLSYLVAPGGFGKTSIALAIAIYAARSGFPTWFLEGEMTAAQMHRRCCLITQGSEPEKDDEGWSVWVREYLRLLLRIEILTDRTPNRVLCECERAADEGAKLVVLDYLQVFCECEGERLVDSSRECLAIRHLSRKIRQFALKSGVHVLAISSRNRNEDGKAKPSISSLYGGTGLEHDCTEAFVLRRYSDTPTEERMARLEDGDGEERICRMILDIAKARDGITGSIPFKYDKETQRFAELSPGSLRRGIDP